jgi:hypothetical protein
MTMSKRRVPRATIEFLERELELLKIDFDKNAELFIHLIKHGGGIYNIHMLDVIRNLQISYLKIAAHTQAVEHAKGKFCA